MSSNQSFIDQVKKMTVMELAALIKDIENEFGVSAAAPVAAVSAAPVAAAAEKTEFKVTLKEAGATKINVIKALRAAIPELGLKEAKDAVEAAPSVIKDGVNKADAQKLKEALEAAGAKVELS